MSIQTNNFVLLQAGIDEGVNDVSNVLVVAFERLGNWFVENASNLIAGLVVLVMFWIIAWLLRLLILAVYRKTDIDKRIKILASRLLAFAVFAIGIFTAITIVVPNFGFADLIAGLGFSSFIIGFATKDILNNFLSGILVLWQQPFKIGDFVVVEDHEGVVTEIGLRATELKMYDGERIVIPNGDMYSSALVIRDAGALQRIRIDLVIDYESKVTRSKELILSALNGIEGVIHEPAPAVYLMKLAIEGINLSVYFWVDTETHGIFDLNDRVSTEINKTLRDAGIKLFPPPPLMMSSLRSGKSESGSEDL